MVPEASLKQDVSIGTSIENTYLTIDENAVQDTAGQYNNRQANILASALSADRIRAGVQRFVANFTSRQLILTFDDIVRKSLLCFQSTSNNREAWNYSLPRTLLMLHALRAAKGFAGLCANDHYSEEQPGRWFQLHLLYRLVMKLQHERARGGILAGLEPVPRADADCPICLKQVEGEGQVWYHLEPCRDWLCSGCGTEYMQARSHSTCTLCKRPIELYVHATSGV